MSWHTTGSPHRNGAMWAVDLTAVALMLGVVVLGFAPTFEGLEYLLPAVGGAVLGMAIAALTAWRRWGVLVVAFFTVAAYFAFGGALALPHTTLFGVPTLDSLRGLALGAVQSWKAIITDAAPVRLVDGHGVVPFIVLLVAGVTATSLALRLRAAAWALAPIVAAWLLEAALGVSVAALPVIQGVALAVAAVGWLGLRHALDPSKHLVSVHTETSSGESQKGAQRRRFVMGAALIAVAAGTGIATSAVTLPSEPRAVLRDVVVPPLLLHEYASPLQSFREYVRDKAGTPQFTVTGMPKDARLRLATLDQYTGTVLNVSDDAGLGSGRFSPLRADMATGVNGTRSTVHVQVDDYTGPWVPTVGAVRSIAYEGEDRDDLRRATYVNEDSAAAVTTRLLTTGDAYSLDIVIPPSPSEAVLERAQFAVVSAPEQTGVPDAVADAARKAIGDADSPIEKVRALEAWLKAEGFFSHGLADDAPSLPGHGAARINSFLSAPQIVGDDEQYAVTMVLMADALGIPARAVMGWHADEEHPQAGSSFVADGDNVHAWVEVDFDGIGWVPFDVTPPEDKKPSDVSPKPRSDPKPQVLQPPPPPQEPAEAPPSVPDSRDSDDGDDPNESGLSPVVFIVGGSVLLLALIAAPFVAILALKARRRGRRQEAVRPADRISGGWDEVVDRAVDLRIPVVAGATRAEAATALSDELDDVSVRRLAQSADLQVFGPGDPSEAEVRSYWEDVDEVVHRMRSSKSRWARMRAKISLRSLVGRRGRGAAAGSVEGRRSRQAKGVIEHEPANS